MAKIFPIKGIMYNVEQDDNLGKYLCPPFDVVDNKDIERPVSYTHLRAHETPEPRVCRRRL